MENYRIALLKLLQIPQLGAQRIGKLLNEVDFATFCLYDKAQFKQIGWNEKQIHHWFNPQISRIEETLTWAEQPNHHLITLFDKHYPFLLRQISTAPPIIFVKGDINVLSLPQIAMVGSRDYSDYGEYWANYFANALVKQQLAITSGLAIGIDGFSHKSALNNNGITLAVLGSGLENIYPVRHNTLAQQIIEKGGALISEFLPNHPPLAENFPRRNRIISGLSLGVLVVEATINSGSLITARYALEQGREVFALPSAIQNIYGQGCHKLIKEGALLVDNVDDILEAIQLQYQPITQQKTHQTQKQAVLFEPTITHPTSTIALTSTQTSILNTLSYTPISIDDIARILHLNVETVLIEILNMELSNAVKQVTGGYIRAT